MGFGKSKGKGGKPGWGGVRKTKGGGKNSYNNVYKGAYEAAKKYTDDKGKGKGKKGKGKGKKATSEDLDSQLEKYMGVEAVQSRLNGELDAYMKAD